jgi:hypothetical protein
MRNLLIVCALIVGSLSGRAQGSAGSGAKLEPRFIVDLPTAGMPGSGAMAVDAEIYQQGGMQLGMTYGIFSWWSVGVFYGGANIIGSESPVMNPLPGFELRFRALNETLFLPALLFGFNSQGHGGYLKALDRYVYKSPGIFMVLSKNYQMLGFLSIHGGVAYTLERADGNRNADVYMGAEKTLGPFLSFLGEYDMALNDNASGGKGRGYLNLGVRCTLGGGLTLGICARDLLKNNREVGAVNRVATLEFVHAF